MFPDVLHYWYHAAETEKQIVIVHEHIFYLPLYLNFLGESTTCHGLNTTIPIRRIIIYTQNSHARSKGVGEFFTFFEPLNNDLHSIVHAHSMILLVWVI